MAVIPFQDTISYLLNQTRCVQIPRYQRRYAWKIDHAHQLIVDLSQVATSSVIEEEKHWIGVSIYKKLPREAQCEIGISDHSHECVELIDGQQRLTTIRLWIIALLHHGEANGIRSNTKLNVLRLQSPNDIEYQRVLDEREAVFQYSDNISQVYIYFRYMLWLGENSFLEVEPVNLPRRNSRGDTTLEKWENYAMRLRESEGIELKSTPPNTEEYIRLTLQKFELLFLQVSGNDDPVRIFSSLNGNREELSQFDHLRNLIFSELGSQLSSSERDDFYTKYWAPAEAILEEVPVSSGKGIDAIKNEFLYDYLISIGEGSHGKFNASSSYSTFVKFMNNRLGKSKIQDWVKGLADEVTLWTIQKYNFAFIGPLPSGKSFAINQRSSLIIPRIRFASDGPPAPVVEFILRRHALPSDEKKHFTADDVRLSLLALEGHLFKTLLNGDSLTNFRAWTIKKMKDFEEKCIKSDTSTASDYFIKEMKSQFLITWQNVVNHQMFEAARDPREGIPKTIYGIGAKQCLALLDAICEQMSGGAHSSLLPSVLSSAANDPYWVEHIYPQSASRDYPTIGARDWAHDIKKWGIDNAQMASRTNCLGNLTILPSVENIKGGNKSLVKKIQLVIDARDNPENHSVIPPINNWLNATEWTPPMIDARSVEFFEMLGKRWSESQL